MLHTGRWRRIAALGLVALGVGAGDAQVQSVAGPVASPSIRSMSPENGGAVVRPVLPSEQPTTATAPAVTLLALTTQSRGVPQTVLAAYQQAADGNALRDPGCGLSWPVLAGIGKVESNHAHNGDVTADGELIHPIYGPSLDGTNGTTPMRDSTGQWVRAVGPMQFLPSTWTAWGAGSDPQNVFAATAAAARYLCANGRNVGSDEGLRQAILSYNPSGAYLDEVTRWIRVYQGGALVVPDNPNGTDDVAGPPVPSGPSQSSPPSSTAPPPGPAPAPTGPRPVPVPPGAGPTPPPTPLPIPPLPPLPPGPPGRPVSPLPPVTLVPPSLSGTAHQVASVVEITGSAGMLLQRR